MFTNFVPIVISTYFSLRLTVGIGQVRIIVSNIHWFYKENQYY